MAILARLLVAVREALWDGDGGGASQPVSSTVAGDENPGTMESVMVMREERRTLLEHGVGPAKPAGVPPFVNPALVM